MLAGRQPGPYFHLFIESVFPVDRYGVFAHAIRRIGQAGRYPVLYFMFLIFELFQLGIRRIHLGDTPYGLYCRIGYRIHLTEYGVFTPVIRRIGYLDTVATF